MMYCNFIHHNSKLNRGIKSNFIVTIQIYTIYIQIYILKVNRESIHFTLIENMVALIFETDFQIVFILISFIKVMLYL